MIYLERHDPAGNVRRFYVLDTGPDLFGHWVVTRRWGRIGTGPGRSLRRIFPSLDAARAEADRLARQKQRRGYLPA